MKLSPGVCTSKNWTLEDLAKEFSETDGGATWYLKFTCKFIVGQTQTQTLGEIVKKKDFQKAGSVKHINHTNFYLQKPSSSR